MILFMLVLTQELEYHHSLYVPAESSFYCAPHQSTTSNTMFETNQSHLLWDGVGAASYRCKKSGNGSVYIGYHHTLIIVILVSAAKVIKHSPVVAFPVSDYRDWRGAVPRPLHNRNTVIPLPSLLPGLRIVRYLEEEIDSHFFYPKSLNKGIVII